MIDRVRLLLPVALATTLVLWASAFPGIRAGLAAYDAGHLVLLRFLVASAAFAVVAMVTRMRPPDLKDVPGTVVVGVVGIAVYQVTLTLGERTVSAGAASVLVNTVPFFTAILAVVLLGERPRRSTWLGMAVGFSGVLLIAVGEGEGFRVDAGAILILVAALAHSLHFVLQKSFLVKYRPLEFTAYSVWAGTLILLVFLPGLPNAVRSASVDATLAVAYLGVFPGAVANVAWALVLSRWPASRAARFLYLVPTLAFLIAWLWLGEVPGMVSVVGGTVALAGVVYAGTAGDRERTPVIGTTAPGGPTAPSLANAAPPPARR